MCQTTARSRLTTRLGGCVCVDERWRVAMLGLGSPFELRGSRFALSGCCCCPNMSMGDGSHFGCGCGGDRDPDDTAASDRTSAAATEHHGPRRHHWRRSASVPSRASRTLSRSGRGASVSACACTAGCVGERSSFGDRARACCSGARAGAYCKESRRSSGRWPSFARGRIGVGGGRHAGRRRAQSARTRRMEPRQPKGRHGG